MPVQIEPVTPRREDIDTIHPITLTPSQQAVQGAPTPELTRFPRHLFPQLKSLTKEQSWKRPLGLEPLPMSWEYVIRPDRAFQNQRLLRGPAPRPPPSPWGGPKKQLPTAYYVEQMEMARPTLGPDPFYQEPLPPTVAPLQRFVMFVLGYLALLPNFTAMAEMLSRAAGLSGVAALATLSWGKALLSFVLWSVSFAAVFLVKMAMEVVETSRVKDVEVLFLAIMIARWFPGLAGQTRGEIEVGTRAGKPLYILRIPRGGAGSCPVYRCS